MILIVKFARWCMILGALGAAIVALLAYFGFVVPDFDLLNHAQLFLFPTTLIGVAIIAWLARGVMRPLGLMLSLLGVLASGAIMVPDIASSFAPRAAYPTDNREVITMMTHNLFGMNYEMEKVTATITAEDPDILVFQEYFGEQARELDPLIAARYPYSVRCKGGKRANLGLYSKLPFDQTLDGQCPENAYSTDRTAHILAGFTLPDGERFSVMTTHLDWPIPVARQMTQLADLSTLVGSVSGPLILAGDFNSTSWSYALRNFADSSGLTRQDFNLLTYPMSWFYFGDWRDTLPFLPLDHVMTRGDIAVHELHTAAPTGSDHLPIVFKFTVGIPPVN